MYFRRSFKPTFSQVSGASFESFRAGNQLLGQVKDECFRDVLDKLAKIDAAIARDFDMNSNYHLAEGSAEQLVLSQGGGP